MADVRLTATNPEDSSVVPVACDAAGRLLLEEPQVIEGPPGQQGPPGEQGPPGQDGQDGDPFSGNFAGDVTFGGSADFAGNVTVTADSGNNECLLHKNGFLYSNRDNGNKNNFEGQLNGTKTSVMNAAGTLTLGTDVSSTLTTNITLNGIDGSGDFAGGKAGFTAEGYLWCTTRRGDTVILDATSNGLASWVEYTPNTRIEEIRDKLDANRGDTGEMPADTQ